MLVILLVKGLRGEMIYFEFSEFIPLFGLWNRKQPDLQKENIH